MSVASRRARHVCVRLCSLVFASYARRNHEKWGSCVCGERAGETAGSGPPTQRAITTTVQVGHALDAARPTGRRVSVLFPRLSTAVNSPSLSGSTPRMPRRVRCDVTRGGAGRRAAPWCASHRDRWSAALLLGLPAGLPPAGAHGVDREWARRPAASSGAPVEGRRPQARPSPGRHGAASGRSPPIG